MKKRVRRRRLLTRGGFSLAETLVAVAVAAVTLPAALALLSSAVNTVTGTSFACSAEYALASLAATANAEYETAIEIDAPKFCANPAPCSVRTEMADGKTFVIFSLSEPLHSGGTFKSGRITLFPKPVSGNACPRASDDDAGKTTKPESSL